MSKSKAYVWLPFSTLLVLGVIAYMCMFAQHERNHQWKRKPDFKAMQDESSPLTIRGKSDGIELLQKDIIPILPVKPAETDEANPAGRFRVKALVSGWAEGFRESDGMMQTQLQYYHPDGKLIRPTVLNEHPLIDKQEILDNSHLFAAVVEFDAFSEERHVDYYLFDKASGLYLGYDSATIEKGKKTWDLCRFNLRTWRTAPAYLVVDVKYGVLERKEIAMKNGASVAFGGYEYTYYAIMEGHAELDIDRFALDLVDERFIKANDGPNQSDLTSFLFAVLPHKEGDFYPKLQVVTHDGETLLFRPSLASGYLFMTSIYMLHPEEIDKMYLISPRNFRCFIEVLAAPGMPPANSEVDNLFDVRIPYIRFDHDGEFLRLHEPLLLSEMKFEKLRIPNIPFTRFPMQFYNVTIRDLYGKYLSYYPDPAILEVDEENSCLTIKRLKPLKERIKEIVQKVMQTIKP